MNPSPESSPLLFSAPGLRAHELTAADIPRLQVFFVANPEYFIAVNGAAPREDEARREFEDRPPPSMPFGGLSVIGFVDDSDALVGIASVLSDFLVQGVWHIGLFIVATSLHGTGRAGTMYRHLDDWMRSKGAQWVRLGVVLGNHRAERFWHKVGYAEVRRRLDVPLGARTSTVRVLVKILGDGHIGEYLRLVERDRPESTAP